jgi:predicted RNase H-like HicB family nuclease
MSFVHSLIESDSIQVIWYDYNKIVKYGIEQLELELRSAIWLFKDESNTKRRFIIFPREVVSYGFQDRRPLYLLKRVFRLSTGLDDLENVVSEKKIAVPLDYSIYGLKKKAFIFYWIDANRLRILYAQIKSIEYDEKIAISEVPDIFEILSSKAKTIDEILKEKEEIKERLIEAESEPVDNIKERDHKKSESDDKEDLLSSVKGKLDEEEPKNIVIVKNSDDIDVNEIISEEDDEEKRMEEKYDNSNFNTNIGKGSLLNIKEIIKKYSKEHEDSYELNIDELRNKVNESLYLQVKDFLKSLLSNGKAFTDGNTYFIDKGSIDK